MGYQTSIHKNPYKSFLHDVLVFKFFPSLCRQRFVHGAEPSAVPVRTAGISKEKTKSMIMREIIAHYKKTSCFVYIFFLIGYGALSLRFIWQTRKSIVGDSCNVSVPRDPSVKITPKILAKFASLNSSIAHGALHSRRCLR